MSADTARTYSWGANRANNLFQS